LGTLTDREREVIKLRFGLSDGLEATLEEVAHKFNLTRERIRQIQFKAVSKLQIPIRRRHLDGLLDEDE
jgi:RNA polymerase primary sigma factor